MATAAVLLSIVFDITTKNDVIESENCIEIEKRSISKVEWRDIE